MNQIGESSTPVSSVCMNVLPSSALHTSVTKSTLHKKLKTTSARRIFRTSSSPPAITKGVMLAVPIHQLAVDPTANQVMTTAIAAGLNRCR